MPSPVGHMIAGAAAGWLVCGPAAVPSAGRMPGRTRWREAVFFAALGALPDVDLVMGAHSGPTHSIGAAVVVGAGAAWLARRIGVRDVRSIVLALACAAAYGSHVLLDWLSTDASPPIGIMALWPFSSGHYESNLHVFMAISRRYHQGWTFVRQNVLALAWELAVLVPALVAALLYRSRGSAKHMRIAAFLFVIVTALTRVVPAHAQTPEYADMVAAYRRGAFDDAIERLLKTPMSAVTQRGIREWLKHCEKVKQTDDIAAALMMHSEVVFVSHAEAPGIGSSLSRGRIHQDLVTTLQRSLKQIAPRTNFIRTWYLMWESFRQGYALPEADKQTDFLPDALDAFPDDPYVLLAIGARHELYWWLSPDNGVRDASAGPAVDSRDLRSAEEWLRKSVASDPSLAEARLRLARVLSLRGQSDAAQAQLAAVRTDDPNYRYLLELFFGQARERAGDTDGAAAAYARAIGLVEWPQAARVAAAHLAYGSGRRIEAAGGLTQSLATGPDAIDPWSVYIRGQWWYLQNRMRRARALVMSAAPAVAK
jgi:membrane-bound metal-dependent hydrolase YbcI (DUF457 family)/tetratricopeptide (TPR) repeat protein